jgi:hypothetical protein
MPRSYQSDTHTPLLSLHPGPVLPIFPFAPVGITEIVSVGITISVIPTGAAGHRVEGY